MKKVFLMTLFSAFSAIACPELSGRYICGYDQSTGEPNVLNIHQTDQITFKIILFGKDSEITFTANGQLLTLEDETYSRNYLTICAPDTNALLFTGSTTHKNERWTQRISANFKKTSERNLDYSIGQDLFGKDKDTHFSTTFHCQKN